MVMNEAELTAEMQAAQAKVKNMMKRIRRWTLEKRLDDDAFRTRNEFTEELPPLAEIQRVYVLTWRKDGRPIVVRQGDASAAWGIPSVEREPGEGAEAASSTAKAEAKAFDAWLKETAQELWGIRVRSWYQAARLHLTATSEARDVPPGTERYYLFLCATASGLDDIPEGAGWSRRAITTKEFVSLLREHYVEYDEILDQVHDGYLIRQAQG